MTDLVRQIDGESWKAVTYWLTKTKAKKIASGRQKRGLPTRVVYINKEYGYGVFTPAKGTKLRLK